MRDVIVIGAGGGGAVVAKELAARGLDVLVLEAGARHADEEQAWNHFEFDANESITGYLRFGPSDRAKTWWRRDVMQNGGIFQCAGVGGTTQHFFANTPRAMPGAFLGHQRRPGEPPYDADHPFPFTYRSLVPYYEWVEATLPVRTSAIGRKEVPFLEAAERMGLPLQRAKDVTRPAYRPQENSILQPEGTAGRTADPSQLHHPQARGCTFCGHCYQGCVHPHGAPRNLRAKRSTENSYIPMALTADRWAPDGRAAALVTDAFVTRIETAPGADGRPVARGVTWRDVDSGAVRTEDAKVVVLSAGAIETPRLWLNSGLPNPNDWVGRGMTTHHMDWITGIMPDGIGASRGPNSAARVDVPGRGCIQQVIATPAVEGALNAWSDSGIHGQWDNGAPVGAAGAGGVGARVGRALKDVMARLDRLMTILVITDDDVDPRNRVSLAPPPSDDHGPVARVEHLYREASARTRANREDLSRRAVDLLRAAGAASIHRTNLPPLLIHIHSTMRMGTDERTSVVAPTGESRAVRGLYVADNSALANAIGGPNPTLTTQAVATRTAEGIFARDFGGDPWVGSSAPLSSIDDAVTAAVIARGL